ncbi:MAG TPA: hypothetical protein VNC39_01470 [Acidocella sp.]|jgi:hypothetical protein|uniref:hypothetical protein n=1 Tax=Acidocella sp. TaxID=50710 RepID=UPI002CEB224F|nr:hypothetical protein [Acidocella sp.]HVE20619.1 hypothetical protein [Acidocella sp.]
MSEILDGLRETVMTDEENDISRSLKRDITAVLEYVDHMETYLAGAGLLDHFKQVWAEGQAMKKGRQSTP